jgi:hypothetical protein
LDILLPCPACHSFGKKKWIVRYSGAGAQVSCLAFGNSTAGASVRVGLQQNGLNLRGGHTFPLLAIASFMHEMIDYQSNTAISPKGRRYVIRFLGIKKPELFTVRANAKRIHNSVIRVYAHAQTVLDRHSPYQWGRLVSSD